MESLFVRVLTLSLTGSAVLLPLLLLAPRLRGRYAAGTLSVLWLVLALRMALPVPLSLPWTAVTVDVSALPSVTLPAARRAPAEVSEPAGPESVEPPRAVTPAAAPEGRPLPLLELAAWVWLAGGLALAGYQGAAYLLARRRLLRGAQPGTEEERAQLAALAAELGLRRTPRLLKTEEADAPLVVGLGRLVLLLPGRPLPADEREVVLLHELTHLRRHDLAHKALLFVPCAVHWFNPLVWWMAREAGRTLELCCDARVVRGRDEAFRRRYGTALLHLAAGGRGPVLSTRFGGGGRLLRARLANLFQHRRRGAAAAGLVLAAALAVTSLAACEQRLLTAEEAMDALEESIEVREYDIGPGELEYCISFRLPEHSGPEEEWNLHIAGRAETEALGGISLHYFDGEDWTAEKTYGIYLSSGQAADLTELTMEVWPPTAAGQEPMTPPCTAGASTCGPCSGSTSMWTPGAFPWPCRSPGRTSGRCRRWTAAVCCSIAGPWGRSAAASRSCTLRRNPWRRSQAGIPCWAARRTAGSIFMASRPRCPACGRRERGYRSSTMRCIRPCTPTRRSCCPSGRRADHRRQLPAPHPRRRRASSSAVMPLI